MVDLYLVLVILFKLDNRGFTDVITWESIFTLVMPSLTVIAVVLCASRISCQNHRFRSILQLTHNCMLPNKENSNKALLLVRAMLSMKFPRMTACGVLHLEPILILSVFGAVLTHRFISSKHNEILTFLKIQLVHEIKKVLSTTAFLLLFSEWSNLYLVLVILFKLDNRGFTDGITWESIFTLVMPSLTVVAVVLCELRISFQNHRFRSILQLTHNCMSPNKEKTNKALQVVRAVLSMKFPCMTPFGVLHLEPVLILSVFGTVLTHRLLVLSIMKY
ncbi:uncharacterized protein CEXT_170421 [Caerostris extrusa]|uniref:Gustatory receptor n=1 Tax=Caerostris extrusa TaxID=172846 RepID=A0AAV4M775_CAEEX|nr:uncharacterized protein CEXT_170421 [Caerostris extrusa]